LDQVSDRLLVLECILLMDLYRDLIIFDAFAFDRQDREEISKVDAFGATGQLVEVQISTTLHLPCL